MLWRHAVTSPFERLQRDGWIRLAYPDPFVPFTTGFPTPSGKLEFYSEKAIEHIYHFDQEQGLHVEDMRVHSASSHAPLVCPRLAHRLLCRLPRCDLAAACCLLASLGWRGKLGLKNALDGLYLLFAGISFVFTTAATLSFAWAHPFPSFSFW